jgi:hypothetical protein
MGNEALFGLLGCASVATGIFIAFQPPGKTSVGIDDQSAFIASTSAMAPAAFEQDPRSGDEPESTVEPTSEQEYDPSVELILTEATT